MATLVVQHQQDPLRHSATPPPHTPALTLHTPRSTTPIPNKHLPYCPPGPNPTPAQFVTPPTSPPSKHPHILTSSVLHPPTSHPKLSTAPLIFGIDVKTLRSALDEQATKPLPDPNHVFPWMHGLHPENHIQLSFFAARKKSLRRLPKGVRGITIIKAGGDLSGSRLKGAVAPDEILSLSDTCDRGFLDCDPKEGFSVRNFAIQTAKSAPVSDMVIYGDDSTSPRIIKSVATRTAHVQRKWKKDLEAAGQCPETFNTFVLTTPFEDVEKEWPDLVAIDSQGVSTGQSIDFLQMERAEMWSMSKASEITTGVYQGPSPDKSTVCDNPDSNFDVFVETSDHAPLPDSDFLDSKLDDLDQWPVHLSFPSSGSILPPSWSQTEVDSLVAMCRFMYRLTHPDSTATSTAYPTPPNSSPASDVAMADLPPPDRDNDIPMRDLTPSPAPHPVSPRQILLHCADGYTESSLLAVAYTMFAERLPVHAAWKQLHCARRRNFFAYPSDVALLVAIQDRLLAESPLSCSASPPIPPAPAWLVKLDGSLPSRILPYMYLGNLTHANNPDLLRELEIKRILSIGEPVGWSKAEHDAWAEWGGDLMMVDGVQDNGIDPLTGEFERCLQFIGRGKADASATLVHCRVGVSRSATICIAEVMSSLGLSFPRAYCFVRARRLNVIIQPHLRFVYELMKWDEVLQAQRVKQAEREKREFQTDNASPDDVRRSGQVRRETEWPSVCREIAGLNRPYARS